MTHIIAAILLGAFAVAMPQPKDEIRDLGPLPRAPRKGVSLPYFVDPDFT